MRGLLSDALKDNQCLEKCVMTGILRVAKESIFSGLNNLEVFSLIKKKYNTSFGFTENEVGLLLSENGLTEKMAEVSRWYNGYLFGGEVIYNPWSILSYVNTNEDGLRPYWVNTTDNAIVRKLLSEGSDSLKKDLETLTSGGYLAKQINDEVVYKEIELSNESVWSFLLFSGYLKADSLQVSSKGTFAHLKIPNLEVQYLYEQFILNWFSESIDRTHYEMMLKALLNADIYTFDKIFRNFVVSSFSFFDTQGKKPEKVYHAFVLGLLVSLSDTYEVKSNRESGYGRYDIMLIPKKPGMKGVIFEFKTVDSEEGETLEAACEAALCQIRDKDYRRELLSGGVTDVLELAIAFEGKRGLVKKGD